MEIEQILDVSIGSISGWKQAYEQEGLAGLRLKHKGRISYLTNEQRKAVLRWLQTKQRWEVGELEYHLAEQYDVVYESKQSYYDLFEAAGMSWKKTTKVNPKVDPKVVPQRAGWREHRRVGNTRHHTHSSSPDYSFPFPK